MKFTLLKLILVFFTLTIELTAQDLHVYQLQSAYIHKETKTTTGFISVSDNYRLPEHPDSLVFPDSISQNGLEYAVLEGKYRTMLLDSLSITETDSVFAYDFINDSIYTFLVQHLKAVAILNPYDMGGQTYPQYYYMIGFEVDPKAIGTKRKYLHDIFVSIGSTNPFSNANLHPVKWTEVDSSYFPTHYITPERLQRRSRPYLRGKAYEYIDGNLGYYTQDILNTNHLFSARHVVVVDICTDEILLNNFYTGSEGTSVTPLNNVHEYDTERTFQWTGNLLKNQSSVIFGFTSQSFGCIRLHLIEQPARYINLFCDNRH